MPTPEFQLEETFHARLEDRPCSDCGRLDCICDQATMELMDAIEREQEGES